MTSPISTKPRALFRSLFQVVSELQEQGIADMADIGSITRRAVRDRFKEERLAEKNS